MAMASETLTRGRPLQLSALVNAGAAAVLAAGLAVVAYRFRYGLGAVTTLSQVNAWGLWKGFNVITGVALGAGGYTLACAVYILGLREYRPVVRAGVLAGFLAYGTAVVGLLIDVGQPWRIPYPLVYSFGVTSVMFEVAWCMCLYLVVLAFEFSPAVYEWLGWRRPRERTLTHSAGFVAFGVILSSRHQPSLGALFLMAPSKLHPLWYSRFMPVLFFISSIVAGLAMVIVVSGAARRLMPGAFSASLRERLDPLTVGLGRGAALVLFSYLFLQLQALVEGAHWSLLRTGWGGWYLVELLGFVAAPCALLAVAAHCGHASRVRLGAAWALAGIVLNRMNVSVIALNWDAAERYLPSWQEWLISLALVTAAVLAFRWVAHHLPVFRDHPQFHDVH
jgi:Ni/Fe-hydrogenase subunit HybB-like protein